ncbi:MAG: ComF family protein [Planctomycetota bacterium]|jgi:ComF family protein
MNLPAWNIARAFRSCARGLADLLLPSICGACAGQDVAAEGLCSSCNTRLLSLVALGYCPRCGTTLGPNVPAREDGCWACPSILPRFERVIRLGPYADPLRQLVRDLKYRRREVMRRRLGAMLAEGVAADTERKFDLVLAVPMHWRRRLARGCEHARLLARELARRLELPLGDELVRVRHTQLQTSLSRTQRIQNVRGAFGLSSSRALAGANVLLVDDVTTTGATANEAARTLLGGGAERVTLAVIAKAEPPTAYAEQVQGYR